MLRYGQILKLTKPQPIMVNARYKTLIGDLKKHFGGSIQLHTHEDPWGVREWDTYKGTVPAGTLGILSFSIISSAKENYAVFVQNPETKMTGPNLKLELGPDDITTNITMEEYKSISEAQRKFMATKIKGIDNLNFISRIEEIRHKGDTK